MQIDLTKVVTLDWETYFDSDYSLRNKNLNTSEYIRDERFVAHCVGIKEGNTPTRVVWYDDIAPALKELDLPNRYMLAHNTAFDGLILSHHYGIVPALYLDTMSMGKALHNGSSRASLDALAAFHGLGNKLPNVLGKMKGHRLIPDDLRADAAAYTAQDVDLCFLLFRMMISVYPESEVQLIDWTIRQFADPVLRVDLERARGELEREIERKRELIAKVAGAEQDLEKVEELLQSANKFAAELRSLGVEPPMKTSPRTKLQTFAFSQQDDEFMQLVNHEQQEVRELVEARLAAKSTIGETRAQRFLNVGDGTLCVGQNYFGAHTGRWSGANKMNLHNLPKIERDPVTKEPIPGTGELRQAILAPPGHQIVVADSSQIEARTLAWVAGQHDLLEVFHNKGDPYKVLASEIYGKPPAEITKDERAVGKAGVLGLGYYMGAARFQGSLAMGILGPKMEVPIEFCQRVVTTYRKKNHRITALWRDMSMILYRMLMKKAHGQPDEYSQYKFLEYDAQSIWLPNGLALHYPDLRAEWNDHTERFEDYHYRSNKEFVRIHAGVLTENLIQALARVIIGEQLLQINERYRAVLMTHDEIVCVAPDAEAEACLQYMFEVMSTSPAWAPDLPLAAEGGYAPNYSK